MLPFRCLDDDDDEVAICAKDWTSLVLSKDSGDEEDCRWNDEAIDDFYKAELKWLPEDALMQSSDKQPQYYEDMVTNTKQRRIEETTASKADKAGFTPAAEWSAALKNGDGLIQTSEPSNEDDSSDEDTVDPILEKEFYRQLRESDGFDVDITIPHPSFSMSKCDDNDRDSYRDMLDIYAKVGLHWYNFHKGSNFQLSTIYKYNSVLCNIFAYYITLEGMDPADKSSFTFQASVIRAACVNDEQLKIISEGCRIKPQIPSTGDKIHRWDYMDETDEFYKGKLPKWYSDDALVPSSERPEMQSSTLLSRT